MGQTEHATVYEPLGSALVFLPSSPSAPPGAMWQQEPMAGLTSGH